MSKVPKISFIPIGKPCNCPRGFPAFLFSSASVAFSNNSFLSKYAQAFTSFSNLSYLSMYAEHSSTDEISPDFNLDTNSLIDKVKIFDIKG